MKQNNAEVENWHKKMQVNNIIILPIVKAKSSISGICDEISFKSGEFLFGGKITIYYYSNLNTNKYI